MRGVSAHRFLEVEVKSQEMASGSARECNLNRGDVRPKPSLA